MHLQGHLLYIDITQICGIGCAFCMYLSLRQIVYQRPHRLTSENSG